MRINHNIAALNTYGRLSSNNALTQKSLEKLSSGLRINRAGDDAAGLAISEKMRAQIKGLDQASRNSQDAISLIQTAEGALSETHSILQRMRELAVQSANDTNVSTDRNEIQKEINQLTSEINRIGSTTQFNTKNLLNGDVANTLTTITGNFADAAGATITSGAGFTGVSGVAFTGSNLASGTIHAVIRRSGEAVADVTGSIGETSGATGQDISGAFTGGTISYTAGVAGSGSGTYMIDSGLKVSFNFANQTVTLSGSGADGKIDDTVNLIDGKIDYDNHGISFSFNSSGITADGTLQFQAGAVTLGAAATLSANTVGYSGTSGVTFVSAITTGTANVSGDLSGASDLPDDVVEWTIVLSGSSGQSGMVLSGNGTGDTTIHDVFSGSVAGGKTVNAYGLNFTVTGEGAKVSGTMTFTTTPTYSYFLKVDSGAETKIASGVSTAGLTGTAAASGISFSGTNILAATSGEMTSGTFDVLGSRSSGTDQSLAFQIGANQSQSLALDISDMRSVAIGIAKSGSTATGFSASVNVTNGVSSTNSQYALDVTTAANASSSITTINDAINTVSSERSKLGAYQNRLEHTINNLTTASENLTASESRIRDVDMAKEMMEFSKMNILSQAATSMLAQANQQPQGVLQLLR